MKLTLYHPTTGKPLFKKNKTKTKTKTKAKTKPKAKAKPKVPTKKQPVLRSI